MLLIVEHIRQGFAALRSHKARAIITAAIIAIGITALVGILTSIDAMGGAITKTMSRFGSQNFNSSTRVNVSRFGAPSEIPNITYDQAKQFEHLYKGEATIAFSVTASFNSKVRYKSKETNPNIKILGIDEDYMAASSFELAAGRNFTSNDVSMSLPLAIIGADVVALLYGADAKPGVSIGKTIAIDGKPYRVIGELNKKGSSLGMSGGDRNVFLGLLRTRQDFTNAENNIMISVLVNSVGQLDEEVNHAQLSMRRVRLLKPTEDDNFSIVRSDSIAADVKENLSMISSVGTLIAVITLLGAAVSLMNIMLVSVTERTREIGIRKSLGATESAIRNQFLVEALVICQLGGIAGVIFGLGLGNMVGYFLGADFIAPWNWVIVALIVCVVVGLVAGIYPANKAAKLNPIEALRHEG